MDIAALTAARYSVRVCMSEDAQISRAPVRTARSLSGADDRRADKGAAISSGA